MVLAVTFLYELRSLVRSAQGSKRKPERG
jgi:hypothetical protein